MKPYAKNRRNVEKPIEHSGCKTESTVGNGSGSNGKKKKELVHLPLWRELVSVLEGLHSCEDSTFIETREGTILIPNTQGTKYVQEILSGNIIRGKKIGILRTDLPDKPLVLRLIT